MAGLDFNLQEWTQLGHKSWENEKDYLQRDRFAKIGGCKLTSNICKKKFDTYVETTP